MNIHLYNFQLFNIFIHMYLDIWNMVLMDLSKFYKNSYTETDIHKDNGKRDYNMHS